MPGTSPMKGCPLVQAVKTRTVTEDDQYPHTPLCPTSEIYEQHKFCEPNQFCITGESELNLWPQKQQSYSAQLEQLQSS